MAEGAQRVLGADVADLGHRCRRARRDGGSAGRHGLVRDRRSRVTRPRRSPRGCRSTASASASSRRSRCSTCCGCACSRCLDDRRDGLRRAFVAVVPPPEVLDAVERVVAPVRPVAPPGSRGRRAASGTSRCSSSARSTTSTSSSTPCDRGLHGRAPVRLGLGGAGAFPSASRASVVWIGLDEGTTGARRDRRRGAAGDRAARLRARYRDLHPHVTIARSSRARPLASVVAALGDGPVGPAWVADEVVVLESDTRPTGAVYREVAHIPLRS